MKHRNDGDEMTPNFSVAYAGNFLNRFAFTFVIFYDAAETDKMYEFRGK